MFIALRALTYSSVSIVFLLIYLPARLLALSGIVRPEALEAPQIVGLLIGSAGAVVVLWCVYSLAWIGKGTPAPFDPPRVLVVQGLYRYLRNPMYAGSVLVLGGAALIYDSVSLLVYGCIFLAVAHFFVVIYEEPTLRQTFGPEYEAYCHRVGRWWPAL